VIEKLCAEDTSILNPFSDEVQNNTGFSIDLISK